jgi:threonine synthase
MPATLGEGNTPLVASARIGPRLGAGRLFFKLENCNPSGSYKDRFVAAEVSQLLQQGARACVATSSGNTGSSLASYGARYGLLCLILVNEDAPAGKLAQMQAHGAQVIRIAEFTKDPDVTSQVFAHLQVFSAEHSTPLVVSAYRYCPAGMRGVESIAQELDKAPVEHVFTPVGGGGLYSAVVQGFQNLGRVPRVHAVQPAGCSTVVASFERGDSAIRSVVSATRISGLSVPFDIDGGLALKLLRECGGHGFACSDEQIFEAQRWMLEQEGIYCEPAGAAALAGWIQALDRRIVQPDETCVCLVTGHGFKDPESIAGAAMRHPDCVTSARDLNGLLVHLLSQAAASI